MLSLSGIPSTRILFLRLWFFRNSILSSLIFFKIFECLKITLNLSHGVRSFLTFIKIYRRILSTAIKIMDITEFSMSLCKIQQMYFISSKKTQTKKKQYKWMPTSAISVGRTIKMITIVIYMINESTIK